MRSTLLIGCLSFLLNVSNVTAAAIDTQQFGFLREGMVAEEIVSRVGPPDLVQVRATELRLVRPGVLRAVQRESWVYASDGASMTTILSLDNGVLIAKEKRK